MIFLNRSSRSLSHNEFKLSRILTRSSLFKLIPEWPCVAPQVHKTLMRQKEGEHTSRSSNKNSSFGEYKKSERPRERKENSADRADSTNYYNSCTHTKTRAQSRIIFWLQLRTREEEGAMTTTLPTDIRRRKLPIVSMVVLPPTIVSIFASSKRTARSGGRRFFLQIIYRPFKFLLNLLLLHTHRIDALLIT